MNVLIVHNEYLHPGGEDEVVRSELALLRRRGHNVQRYHRANSELQQLGLWGKVKYAIREMPGSAEVYRQIRELIDRHQIDVAHIHNTFSMVTPSAYRACRDAGVPIVQTLHSFRFLCPAGAFFRRGNVCEDCLTKGRRAAVLGRCWKNSLLMSAALTRTIDRLYRDEILPHGIDCFIALSRFSRQYYLNQGFPAERFVVKPNFLEEDPGPGGAPGDYALFVGGLMDYKGVEVLARAWKEGAIGIPLKIVGDGPLRSRVEQLTAGAAVALLGQQPREEVLRLMRAARFVVLPSLCYENCPRVIVEAYACGRGVLASRLGAMAELVHDGETGLHFTAGDAGDLAAKARRLARDDELAARLGRGARSEFEAKYTADQNYEMLLDIYHRVAKRTNQPRPALAAT